MGCRHHFFYHSIGLSRYHSMGMSSNTMGRFQLLMLRGPEATGTASGNDKDPARVQVQENKHHISWSLKFVTTSSTSRTAVLWVLVTTVGSRTELVLLGLEKSRWLGISIMLRGINFYKTENLKSLVYKKKRSLSPERRCTTYMMCLSIRHQMSDN